MAKIVYYFSPTSLKHVLRKLPRSYKVVPIDRKTPDDFGLQLPAVLIADSTQDDVRRLKRLAPPGSHWRAVSLLKGDTPSRARSQPDAHVFSTLPQHVSPSALESSVQKAFENLRFEIEHERTRQELHLAVVELETVNKIGVALSTERNTDALLELILTKSREITGCDAGSLYLAEEEQGGGKHLVFKLTQSDSHSVPFRQFTLPIDTKSIAGYAAATGEILNIKDAYRVTKLPFRLNRDFDQKFGYRTKSMLVVPMKNQKDEVIGVLQFINAKRDPAVKLTSPRVVHREVIPFSQRSQDLASSLASQAAVALENNLLYRDIQRLFEGFVKASVTAIESRDPTTFGHSERVAALTVGLAEAVDRSDSGPYKAINFSRQEIQELRYASLLHDFGKVGVREDVLVKAKKLYPSQLDLIKKRFLYVKKAVELESLRKKVDYLIKNGNQNYLEPFGKLDGDYQSEAVRLEEFLQAILQANEPTVLPEKSSEKLLEIAGWTFDDPSGLAEPLLAPEELRFLSIPKGSLDGDERMQIESHVIHSFRFLSQIPWTKELKNIPNIAKAHHEKLDGSGYPYHMKGEDIPFQSKMMTISDIYDALTARDRPYKRAVPIERALDIIGQEVKSQLLDPVLFHLFVEAKIYQLTAKD
ncbi:MAG TPA: HD domain-containing phosphohydrolase [Terriglobia bacterium]|nr:HD domain-containing phosphohydrolase [Terriglobia bacterium]